MNARADAPGLQTSLLVYGSGGHGKVVADAATSAGWNVHGFADDDPQRAGTRVLGHPIIATGTHDAVAYCIERDVCAVIAVGDNQARMHLFRRMRESDVSLATVVHPSAVIARSAHVGAGTVVFANAIIGPDARVGENVIINNAAAVDHDCVIGDHVHLAPGARTGGTVVIGEGTMLGISACARNNISIGAWSMIGMGSVVVCDLPSRIIAFGNPARVRPR